MPAGTGLFIVAVGIRDPEGTAMAAYDTRTPSSSPSTRRPSTRGASALVAWGLLAGGALFFLGGSLHPKEDPPDVTVKEHIHVMVDDPAWYPSHAVLLLGMGLMAVSLVALVRSGRFADVRAARLARAAAAATAIGTAGMLLHLVVATEADALASGGSTPLVDLHVVVETITVPLFGLAIAALALVGGRAHSLGNRATAVLGVVGGVAYALAGATFLLTDALNPLFPLAGGIGLWAVAAGIGLLRAGRSAPPVATSAVALVVPLVALAVAACGGDDDTSSPSTSAAEGAAPEQAQVVAVDYGFEGLPESISSETLLTLHNDSSSEAHELIAFALPEDETRAARELVALPESELASSLPDEPSLVLVAPPGEDAVTAVGDGTLAPGRYLVFCAIPTGADPVEYLRQAQSAQDGPPHVAGGPPHFTSGMFAELVVE
jgi:hypothetical protein